MVQLEIRQVGKASDFDSDMHRFESCISYQLTWVVASIVHKQECNLIGIEYKCLTWMSHLLTVDFRQETHKKTAGVKRDYNRLGNQELRFQSVHGRTLACHARRRGSLPLETASFVVRKVKGEWASRGGRTPKTRYLTCHKFVLFRDGHKVGQQTVNLFIR